MYQSIYYNKENNGVILFDDELGKTSFEYKSYYYKPTTDETIYKTIFNQPVKKTKQYNKEYFETDIHPILRTLVDRYYQSDEPAKNVIGFFDIECSCKGGFPDIKKGNKPITSICIHINGTYYILLLCEEQIEHNFPNTKIKSYEYEEDLLTDFCRLINKKKVTILSGWNSDRFDIPYIVNRMRRLELDFEQLSPIEIITQRENGFVDLGCRYHLDYLELYKKYSENDRSSFSLKNIAEYEKLKVRKIHYEGKLDDLYDNDKLKFAEYNRGDVEVLVELENKLHYMEIAIMTAHKAHIPYNQIFQQTKIIEGAILTYFKKNNIVSINNLNKDNKKEEGIKGGWVKDPLLGLHENVVGLDFQSEYPNIARTLNMSPGTKRAKVLNWEPIEFYKYNNGKEENKEITISNFKDEKVIDFEKLKKYLDKNNYGIACNGVIFDLREDSFVKRIITEWFNERTEYKKQKKNAQKEKNDKLAKEYDVKQYVMKILLNSFYGAFAMPTFRFYDTDIAEGITMTGQNLTQMTERNVNKYYGEKRVIAADTDSVYILMKDKAEKKDIEDIQNHVNNGLVDICQNLLCVKENKYFHLNYETLSKAALWLAKKKYALYVIDKEGVKPNEENEIIIKGIEVIKSSFPKAMQPMFKDILIDILKNNNKDRIDQKLREFNDIKNSIDAVDIAINTGIKDIGKYYDETLRYKKGAGAHIKAALNHNLLIDKFGLEKEYHKIRSGDKIKYVYLIENNPYRFKELAMSNDEDNEQIIEYARKYIDRDRIIKSVLQNKIKKVYDILGWHLVDFSQEANELYF